jgi:Zn-dependent protease with chaperone function
MQATLLITGVMNEDVDAIRQASTSLIEIAPNNPAGHFFAGLIAAGDGNWEEAERKLLLAEELGMPAEDVQEALASGISTQASIHRWLRRGGYAFGAWIVLLPHLFLVGTLLSRLTLAAVSRAKSTGQSEMGAGERLVRGIYRVIIAITSLYFYVSIPFLILIVVALTGAIFYLFLAIGRIPLRLAAIIALAAVYTLYAIVRSIFVRVRETDPGRPLTQAEAPRLWSLAEEVADRLDARPIEAMYITPAPEIAVTERGGLWEKLRGAGQRCLILGLGALPGMTQGQFRAILAHEYGHFSNRDTAGGNLARQVQVSINHMALRLATTGQAQWFNPAWLFLNGLNRIFLRITLGASRLQEVLADRYAATAYGVQDFTYGLMHIIRQRLVFNLQVTNEIETAQEQVRDLRNLYTLPPLHDDTQLEQVETRMAEATSRPTSPYDSHPAPRERIALLERAVATEHVEENPDPVWVLLPRPDALQADMTAVVEDNLRQRQVLVREATAQPR